ncbi:MAG: hypothetical protein IPG23_11375 [Burkholderiales bacterium]|nr:hypothetical protein [Burkholderiales bacterium]
MSFTDYLTFAVSNIDADTPDHLLPLTLVDNAALATHQSSDMLGSAGWF